MKRSALIIAGLVALCIIGFIIIKKRSGPEIKKRTRFIMSTYCTIQVPGDREVIKAIDKALDRMEEIDKKFNVLNPKSPLYKFNKKNIPVTDKEIISLVRIALKISRKSKGAFDITVHPLIDLWGFYTDYPHLPKKEEIKKYLKNVGYKNVTIKGGKLVKLNKGTEIDLGGIAKGYAVAQGIEVLKKSGIESALVDAGGDVYALGQLNGKPWRVAIRNPRGEGVIGVLEVSDMAIVTSGDYERFFEKDGVRYHHILDPETGYPSKGIISATVISSDPVLADAWSTALFIMGEKEGLNIVEKTEDLEALLITDKKKAVWSSRLGEGFTVTKKGGKK